MEDIIIQKEELTKIIQEALPKTIKEIFTSSYDSPLRNALREEINAQEGTIKKFVRDILTEILANNEFKIKVANEIIAQIIQKGLR